MTSRGVLLSFQDPWTNDNEVLTKTGLPIHTFTFLKASSKLSKPTDSTIRINCECLNISGWNEKGPATCDLLQTLAISRPQQPPWTQVSLLMFLFLLLLFLLCAIANTMNQKRFSYFFVDNFEPPLCQEHSASDTDLSWKTVWWRNKVMVNHESDVLKN